MNFDAATVLVLGDIMLDHYIAGNVERISPEAPVPVVRRQRAWTVPGGAANVARGLARLGCHSRLVSLIGNDAAGSTLRQEIAAEGIEAGLVDSRRPTSCKTRIMARGQQLLRVDEETVGRPSLEEITGLRIIFEKFLPGCSAVILSDYAKGVLLRASSGDCLCLHAIQLAQKHGIPVLVDPKGSDWSRYAGADCVTPNTGEFAQAAEKIAGGSLDAGRLENDAAARMSIAADLCSSFGLGRILLTRGARGMSLFEPGQPPLRIHATMREVADVSGAGDTVIAVLAACIGAGLDWHESADIANTAAGVAVTKTGTAPVGRAELDAALREGRDNPKLFNINELVEKIQEWRRHGERIVFTNGCFDLLHPGHISLLRQSASFGDRLIVGLNSDDSVKRLKGPERPVQNEHARALLLAALQSVDAVILFGDDTPEELIKAIRPDYLVKGSDYKVENIAGAEFVQGYGGQVRLVDLVNGCSTSGLVRRMRKGCE